jgi:serine/threonine protein kinase
MSDQLQLMISGATLDGTTVDFPSAFNGYSYVKTIGQGVSSLVLLVTDGDTHGQFACKVIPKANVPDSQEIDIIQSVHHPNIVDVREVLVIPENVMIVMEHCPGGHLSGCFGQPNDRRRICLQVARAVAHLHSLGIVHRDLKPENILLDGDRNVKLADFGFARRLDADGLLETPCGSPSYAAPEILMGKPYDGQKADVWSLGVLLCQVESGRLPWTATNHVQLYYQISTGNYRLPEDLAPDIAQVVTACLDPHYSKRPTVAQLVAAIARTAQRSSPRAHSLVPSCMRLSTLRSILHRGNGPRLVAQATPEHKRKLLPLPRVPSLGVRSPLRGRH